MKKRGTWRALPVAVLLLAVVAAAVLIWRLPAAGRTVTVGFLYDNDEMTPYSYSFYMAQEAMQDTYGNRVRALMYSNVPEDEIEEPVHRMAAEHCDIIFTNGYGNLRALARQYPEIQFCQVSNEPYPPEEAAPNYHTFKGEIYEGRYLSGVAAGLKLEEMIQRGTLAPEDAKVGFVAAFPYAEVISGFTAFLLGVRSVVPEATMYVKYTNLWSSFTLEKACAKELLRAGCVIISQHSDTRGPAIACEESYSREVYHVGYNIDMTDEAPNTSLTGTRINWTPYVLGAVRAVMEGRPIEEVVAGNLHPNRDMSAGFRENWVELTQLNERLLPEGARERIAGTLTALENGEVQVFSGPYTGVNPEDASDTIDLRSGFKENEHSSIPMFHYILRDVITILD